MSFSEPNLIKKLQNLQETQDSIVSISQWILFHHRYIKQICKIWADVIMTAPSNKILSLLYLCNDVVQQSKHKKKVEIVKVFAGVIPGVIGNVIVKVDEVTKSKIERLITVWESRLVFSPDDLSSIKNALTNPPSSSKVAVEDALITDQPKAKIPKTLQTSPSSLPPTPKSTSSVSSSVNSPLDSKGLDINDMVSELSEANGYFQTLNNLIDTNQTTLNDLGIKSKTYLTDDPSTVDLPDASEYIVILNDLEKTCIQGLGNIEEVTNIKKLIIKSLDNLKNSVASSLKADDSKTSLIKDKLVKLRQTRNSLEGHGNENDNNYSYNDDFNGNYTNSESNGGSDDEFQAPTYDSDSESEMPTPITTPIPPSIPLPNKLKIKKGRNDRRKKSVAFSDNVEIKEYDRDNLEVIKIIKSDDDFSDLSEFEKNEHSEISETSETEPEIDIDDKPNREKITTENDEYDPGTPSVLDLLSKLN